MAGFCLAFLSLLFLSDSWLDPVWLLLVGLTMASTWFVVTIPFKDTSMTYHIGAVPAFAAVGLFGPFPAVFVVALFDTVLWLHRPVEKGLWNKNWGQLGFNVGNQTISTILGAWAIVGLRDLFVDFSWVSMFVPWVAGAIVFDLVNKLFFTLVISFQFSFEQPILEVWKEDGWSSQLIVLIYALGGGLLYYSADQFGLPGILIFYLPILATMYAFKLYTVQAQKNLDQLEAVVQERTKDLEELHQQKDLFLTFLTHDLMTPISSIRFSGDQLKNDPLVSEIGKEHAEIILRSQVSLENMVSNILDIEKLRLGTPLSEDPDLIVLQEVVEDTAELMRPESSFKDINLQVNLAESLLFIFADYHKIERILLNLLSNALKYTPVGGSITVCLEAEGENAVISVVDTGYGIALEDQEKIFNKYVLLKSVNGKAIGSGLGLAIVKELVSDLDGEIELKSQPGKGSSFTVKLPKFKEDDERLFE